jgi:hypothetical protein
MSKDPRGCAEEAVTALDAVLTDRARSHADLAKAIRCVIALRNSLIEERRAGRDTPECLAEVNALISLAFGAEFPLVGFHRDRIRHTRDGIAGLYELR